MSELIEGKIYKCADGEIRRLDRIEEDLLHYSVAIEGPPNWSWVKLSGTYRWQIESDFTKGEMI